MFVCLPMATFEIGKKKKKKRDLRKLETDLYD